MRTWLRWTAAFTAGELVGFGLLPTLGGVLAFLATANLPPTPRALLLYVVAVVGGFGEGAVVARFQLLVLDTALPGLPRRDWIVHTGAAAAAAWALGMLAPTLNDLVGLPLGVTIAIGAVAGIGILLSIGGVQARLLRGVVERPWRWLTANVVGWLAGLPWTFVLPMALPDDAPAAAFGVALAIGGVLMGATTGAVTGLWLVRMIPAADTRP